MTRRRRSRYSPAMSSTPLSAETSPLPRRPPGIRLPAAPALLAGIGRAVWIDPEEGELLRSEEHTSELQSLMRISYAVFCLKKTIAHQNCIHLYISLLIK